MSTSTSSTTEPVSEDFAKPPVFSSDDKVELPVSDFLQFIQSYKQLDFRSLPKPPTNFFIQKLTIKGKTTAEDRVTFDCAFEILVLVDAWTKCDLLKSSTTVHSYKIAFSDISDKAEASTSVSLDNAAQQFGHIGVINDNHSLIATHRGLYKISMSVSVPYLSKEQKGCALPLPTYSLQNHLTFEVTDQNVRIEVDPALETKVIDVAASNTVATAPTIQPPVANSTTTTTASTTKIKSRSNNKSNKKSIQPSEPKTPSSPTPPTPPPVQLSTPPTFSPLSTVIESVFPPTRKLNIYWTPIEVKKETKDDKKKSKDKEKQKEQRPLNVTVEQFTLHSIGGGVISTASEFQYQISHGSVNTFYVLITNEESDKKVRVLRVEGANIKKWEYKKYKPTGTKGTSDASSDVASESSFAQMVNISNVARNRPTPAQLLPQPPADDDKRQKYFIKVLLETGVDGAYSLKVFSEMEMAGQSCQVTVPNLSCLNVNREKGYLANEATANIEISEVGSKQLTKVDVRELPSQLSNRASNPILHGYKFLQTQSTALKLDIKKHDDVAVLVAVIEEAVFNVTYSSGYLYYQALLKVRNTTQDFIKVILPEKSSLWSSSVESKTVRPAKDKQGRILIPLKRSSSESVFTVELFFLRKSIEMKGSGNIAFEFPVFNTPINHAFYTIFVPLNFKYGEFEGDLRESKNGVFSKNVSVQEIVAREKNSSAPTSYLQNNRQTRMNAMPKMQMQMQMQQQVQMPQQQMNYIANLSNFNSNINSNANDDDDIIPLSSIGGDDEKTLSSSVVGVLPVTMQGLEIGQQFRFERLLLGTSDKDEKALKVAVDFKEVPKSWWEKRSLFPYRKLILSVVFGFLAFLVLWLLFFKGSKFP